MDLSRSPADPYMAYQLCRLLLDRKQGLSPLDLAGFIRTFLESAVTTVTFENTATMPKMTLAKGNDVGLFLILGAEERAIVGNVATGYRQHRDFREQSGIHSLAFNSANPIYGRWADQFGALPSRIWIGAYSWGGVVALALGRWLLQVKPDALISICTFGSPKSGDDRGNLALQGLDICRWMNVGDAVTLIPPMPNRAPLMHALLDRDISENFQAFQQTGPGRVLAVDHSISIAHIPPITSIFTELSVTNFLVNNSAPVAIEHALEMYLSRLGAWIFANPEPENVPDLPERIRRLPGQEFALGERNPELDIAGVPVGQDFRNRAGLFVEPLPVAEVMPFLPPVPSQQGLPNPYYYERVNGTHCMLSDGLVLNIFTTKRGARSTVKTWNQAWNKWNRSLAGDSAALDYALEQNFVD